MSQVAGSGATPSVPTLATPKTDALAETFHEMPDWHAIVDAAVEHAKTLERELVIQDAANEILEHLLEEERQRARVTAPSETRASEGYPGVAHDLETMRTALTNLLCQYEGVYDCVDNDGKRYQSQGAADAEVAARNALKNASASSATATTDYEEVLADHRRLCRELDAILSYPDEPARQASLCDLIPFAKSIAKNHRRYRALRDSGIAVSAWQDVGGVHWAVNGAEYLNLDDGADALLGRKSGA